MARPGLRAEHLGLNDAPTALHRVDLACSALDPEARFRDRPLLSLGSKWQVSTQPLAPGLLRGLKIDPLEFGTSRSECPQQAGYEASFVACPRPISAQNRLARLGQHADNANYPAQKHRVRRLERTVLG